MARKNPLNLDQRLRCAGSEYTGQCPTRKHDRSVVSPGREDDLPRRYQLRVAALLVDGDVLTPDAPSRGVETDVDFTRPDTSNQFLTCGVVLTEVRGVPNPKLVWDSLIDLPSQIGALVDEHHGSTQASRRQGGRQAGRPTAYDEDISLTSFQDSNPTDLLPEAQVSQALYRPAGWVIR